MDEESIEAFNVTVSLVNSPFDVSEVTPYFSVELVTPYFTLEQ